MENDDQDPVPEPKNSRTRRNAIDPNFLAMILIVAACWAVAIGFAVHLLRE